MSEAMFAMPRWMYYLLGVMVWQSLSLPAEAGPLLDWLFRRRREQTTYYTPATGAAVNYPYAAGYTPQAGESCGTGYCQQTVLQYQPQVAYRTVWSPVPVTQYRTTTNVNPQTGLPITCTRPCVTYQYQARRVPYTTYRPVYAQVPVTMPAAGYQAGFAAPASYNTLASAGAPAGYTAGYTGAGYGGVAPAYATTPGTSCDCGVAPAAAATATPWVPDSTPGTLGGWPEGSSTTPYDDGSLQATPWMPEGTPPPGFGGTGTQGDASSVAPSLTPSERDRALQQLNQNDPIRSVPPRISPNVRGNDSSRYDRRNGDFYGSNSGNANPGSDYGSQYAGADDFGNRDRNDYRWNVPPARSEPPYAGSNTRNSGTSGGPALNGPRGRFGTRITPDSLVAIVTRTRDRGVYILVEFG